MPFELQSHIEAFVEDKLLIGGHVPEGSQNIYLRADKYERCWFIRRNARRYELQSQVLRGNKTYPLMPITTYFRNG